MHGKKSTTTTEKIKGQEILKEKIDKKGKKDTNWSSNSVESKWGRRANISTTFLCVSYTPMWFMLYRMSRQIKFSKVILMDWKVQITKS